MPNLDHISKLVILFFCVGDVVLPGSVTLRWPVLTWPEPPQLQGQLSRSHTWPRVFLPLRWGI